MRPTPKGWVHVGTFDELTDVAADISTSAVPEPGGLVLVGPLALSILGYQAGRRLRRFASRRSGPDRDDRSHRCAFPTRFSPLPEIPP